MMAQVTAASLASENKVLAHPASVDSITTSGNKEDFVSMGMTAALKLRRIVANTRNVLSIEAMAAAQALDFLAPMKTSPRGQLAYNEIRNVSARMETDRVISTDFAGIGAILAAGKLAEVLR
jgi:histidine ammonia-lyase